VVLSDAAIREALRRGDLVIDPEPSDDLFSPTALDLRIGQDIRRFRPALYTTKGVSVAIHLDVRPGFTRICQLIFERIEGEAATELDSPFQGQTGALGR
jgi:deoxycytidine triphosphate deaminase